MIRIQRGITILSTVLKYDLHTLPIIPRWLTLTCQGVRCFMPHRWKPSAGTPAENLRLAFEALGPLWIKFGQLLSTRRDLLPEDFANELAKLQDKAPAFDNQLAIERIERSLGRPISACFQTFNPIPLAAASIAQVYEATLWDGQAVAVKILRPNIHEQVRQDCQLLQWLAQIAVFFWPASRPFKPVEIVTEIRQTLALELDLRYEAANASLLARHFTHSSLLKVPTVHWEYSTEQVLVTEKIIGTPISQTTQLLQQGVNMKRLAERGVEIFFTQVFRDRFFHADMHAGNIFVIGHPDNPQYAAIDFGIMGTLSTTDQTYLALNFLALFQHDYAKMATCHIESGWVPADTNPLALEAAFRTVLEPIAAKPLKDISFGQILLRLLQVGKAYHMSLQPQLLLLQKTLLAVEGLGRQLYPDLDLWQTAKPFLEQWGKKQFGWKNTVKQLKQHWPFYRDRLPEMLNQWFKKPAPLPPVKKQLSKSIMVIGALLIFMMGALMTRLLNI